MVINILDIGCGNLGSLVNVLNFLNIKNKIINSPNEILKSESLILPGDGSFKIMNFLEKKNYISALNKYVQSNKPLLGICLGMQFFSNKSMEDEDIKGFGWIPGEVKKFETKKNFKVPHIGYNSIIIKQNHKILENIKDSSDFYFVHSYYYSIFSEKNVLTETDYLLNFPSIIYDKNIIGTQFHPEKSQENGIQFLKNFYNFSQESKR
tara:strand:- start:424 stop:1047 length:624 start_codon:yes stop_codon:yes gene_type:complete